MKRIILKSLTVLALACILVTGFLAETTYARQSKCIVSGCNNTFSGNAWYCIKHRCQKSGCQRKGAVGGYCSDHNPKCNNSHACSNCSNSTKKSSSTYSKSSTNSSSKKSYKYSCEDSYDKGYEDVWLDDDYDDDRYEWDDDYALGVDDAMDDEDW